MYEAQESAPVKDDWVLQVNSDLHELNLNKDELKSFKKLRLKKELRKRILNASFNYLQVAHFIFHWDHPQIVFEALDASTNDVARR